MTPREFAEVRALAEKATPLLLALAETDGERRVVLTSAGGANDSPPLSYPAPPPTEQGRARAIWIAIDAYEDGEFGNRQHLKDAVDRAIAAALAQARVPPLEPQGCPTPGACSCVAQARGAGETDPQCERACWQHCPPEEPGRE